MQSDPKKLPLTCDLCHLGAVGGARGLRGLIIAVVVIVAPPGVVGGSALLGENGFVHWAGDLALFPSPSLSRLRCGVLGLS